MFERITRALVTASLAFVGYAVVSVIFALVAGAGVDAEKNLSLEVQGLFIVPFLANGLIAFAATRGGVSSPRRELVAGLASYTGGAVAILLYQAVVSGSVSPLYALVAPVLPAGIVWLLMHRQRATIPSSLTLDHVGSAGTRS